MLSLVLFRFNGRIAVVKLKNGIIRFFLIFVCILAISGCDSKPPRPMPYQTTHDEDITLVNSEYSVSRFWACGWRGGCPEKRWDHCLHVIPKNENAALNWYRSYYRDDLERADWERKSRREKKDGPSSSATESLSTSSMDDSERNEMTQKLKQEHFIKQLHLIERDDPAARRQILLDMQAGIYITASYRISKAGKPDEIHGGWRLSPNCHMEIPEDKGAQQ